MDVDIRNVPPPAEWGVTISDPALEAMADAWVDREYRMPEWDYQGLPRGLDNENWYNLSVLACSVLACIWPPDGKQMWTVRYKGSDLDDAPAIFSCFSRVIHDGVIRLDTFERTTAASFFAGTGILQLLDERWSQLGEVAATLRDDWQGSAANLVEAADFDAEAVVRLLASGVPGFNDAPQSPMGRLPFYKLARLATAMMSGGGTRPLTGLERLPVYPDYMLPMVFRHNGVLIYAQDLGAVVDGRGLVPKESPWELAIRWATVFCGDRLAAALRDRGNPVTTPALDFALWESAVLGPEAGTMGEHHRTLTLAY
jgi:hypothetical protein